MLEKLCQSDRLPSEKQGFWKSAAGAGCCLKCPRGISMSAALRLLNLDTRLRSASARTHVEIVRWLWFSFVDRFHRLRSVNVGFRHQHSIDFGHAVVFGPRFLLLFGFFVLLRLFDRRFFLGRGANAGVMCALSNANASDFFLRARGQLSAQWIPRSLQTSLDEIQDLLQFN